MAITKIHLAVVVLAPIALGTAALAQNAGERVAIQHGTVIDARNVDLEAEAGRGALVGGLAGYAISSGRSASRRARNAILGTAGGAGASAAGQRGQGMQYTVDTGAGKIAIVSDQSQIAVGDCVAVENAGTGSANIRRASSALCESRSVTAATEQKLQREAEDCVAAKDAALAADSDAEVAAAIRAARIACDS
jgi:hypothetical protein